jgi:hypothetical protein
LLRTNAGAYNIGAVGKIIARAVHRPLSDVTRQISASRGVLAERIDADEIRRIIPELHTLGVECLPVPVDRAITFPETTQLRDAKFTEAGLKCEVVTWDGWQLIERPWSHLLLASCTRLVIESTKVVQLERKFLVRREKLLTNINYRLLLDLFLRNPLCHIRIEEGLPGQEGGPPVSPTFPLTYLRNVAKHLLSVTHPLLVNDGVRLLAAGAPPDSFASLTFSTRRDLDLYNLWVLELAEHGLPIPA